MSSIYAPKLINEVLPFEVISYAFALIDPSDPQNGNLPLTLSLVCKSWQQIALRTPCVWSCIRIHGGKTPLTNGTVDVLKKRFRRSGEVGCHFFLELPSRAREKTFESVVSALVQPIASRLETLSLCVPASFLGDLFNVKPFHFPRLRSITIKFPKDDRTPFCLIQALRPNTFSQFSSLTSLDLQHGRLLGFFQKPKTGFSWSNLTYLKLYDRGLQTYDALEIFCLCTNLVRCELTIPGWPLQTLTPAPANLVSSTPECNPYHPPCFHPHLRYLNLEFTSGAISPFFARLSLPKLEDLRLCATLVVDPERVLEALSAMAERHPIEGLKRFEVDRVPCSANAMIRFLKKNEEIETLKLKGCGLSEEGFLGKLIIVPETSDSPYAFAGLESAWASTTKEISSSEFLEAAASPIVPKLKHFWLEGVSYGPDFDSHSGMSLLMSHTYHGKSPKDATVQAFLTLRSPAEGGTLKKVVMDNCIMDKEEFLQELVRLKEGGMVLKLEKRGTSSAEPDIWLRSNHEDWWVT